MPHRKKYPNWPFRPNRREPPRGPKTTEKASGNVSVSTDFDPPARTMSRVTLTSPIICFRQMAEEGQ